MNKKKVSGSIKPKISTDPQPTQTPASHTVHTEGTVDPGEGTSAACAMAGEPLAENLESMDLSDNDASSEGSDDPLDLEDDLADEGEEEEEEEEGEGEEEGQQGVGEEDIMSLLLSRK